MSSLRRIFEVYDVLVTSNSTRKTCAVVYSKNCDTSDDRLKRKSRSEFSIQVKADVATPIYGSLGSTLFSAYMLFSDSQCLHLKWSLGNK